MKPEEMSEKLLTNAVNALWAAKISTFDIEHWVMHPCQFDFFYYLTNGKVAMTDYSTEKAATIGYLMGIPVEFDRTKEIDVTFHELVSWAVLKEGVPSLRKSSLTEN